MKQALQNFRDRFKAILFDMDGTILLTNDAYWKAVDHALLNHGILVDAKERVALQNRICGLGLQKMAYALKTHYKVSVSTRDFHPTNQISYQ